MNYRAPLPKIFLAIGLVLISTACWNDGQQPVNSEQAKLMAQRSLSNLENLEAQLEDLEDARYQIAYQMDEINSTLLTMREEVRDLRSKLNLPPAQQAQAESRDGLPLLLNVFLIVIVLFAFALVWMIKVNRQRETELETTVASPAKKTDADESPPETSAKE